MKIMNCSIVVFVISNSIISILFIASTKKAVKVIIIIIYRKIELLNF